MLTVIFHFERSTSTKKPPGRMAVHMRVHDQWGNAKGEDLWRHTVWKESPLVSFSILPTPEMGYTRHVIVCVYMKGYNATG
ncbi:hypothetical protein DMENIID0001_048720 [Sergentomyia squamirostris]